MLLFISLLFFICRCSSFHFWSSLCCYIFICRFSLFTFSFRCYPSPFRGLSPGFYTHFILSAQPITEWFATHRKVMSFSTIPSTFLPQALRSWAGIFYPQAFFTLRSFTDILTCVYQGFPERWKFFLEVCWASYLSLNTDPAHLFVWFTVIHNLHI